MSCASVTCMNFFLSFIFVPISDRRDFPHVISSEFAFWGDFFCFVFVATMFLIQTSRTCAAAMPSATTVPVVTADAVPPSATRAAVCKYIVLFFFPTHILLTMHLHPTTGTVCGLTGQFRQLSGVCTSGSTQSCPSGVSNATRCDHKRVFLMRLHEVFSPLYHTSGGLILTMLNLHLTALTIAFMRSVFKGHRRC